MDPSAAETSHDESAVPSAPSNDALLAIIANLRAELVQTQSQLQHTGTATSSQQTTQHASAPGRTRRTSIPVPLNGVNVHGHVAPRPASRAASSYRSTRGADSPQFGYPGAPPSSLAAPMAITLSTPPGYTLRRDKSYEDLASVIHQSQPSPTTRGPRKASFTQAQNRKLEDGGSQRRRSNSIGSGTGVNGSSSRIPMPVLPKGSVGTATTLAGGSSPKSPPYRANGGDSPETRFEAPSSPLARDEPYDVQYTNGNSHSDTVEELDMQSRSASLPLPSLSPNLSSPTSRGPRYSTESEVSLDTPDSDSRVPRSSAPVRAGSSPFFGGSAGFTERHGKLACHLLPPCADCGSSCPYSIVAIGDLEGHHVFANGVDQFARSARQYQISTEIICESCREPDEAA